MPMQGRDRLSVSLSAQLVAWVRKRAADDGVSVSAIVEAALVEYRHSIREADERRARIKAENA